MSGKGLCLEGVMHGGGLSEVVLSEGVLSTHCKHPGLAQKMPVCSENCEITQCMYLTFVFYHIWKDNQIYKICQWQDIFCHPSVTPVQCQ